MSGHSKWSTIKRAKAVTDAKKGQVFTKLARAITVSAREGGGDPAANPNLRLAIEKARGANMPKDNIEKAIMRGTGALPGQSFESFVLEGYGPHGVAIVVECLTDNRNRTVAEVRGAFTRHGGSLGASGSAAYVFQNGSPTFTIDLPEQKAAQVVKLIEALEESDDVQEVLANLGKS